MAAKACRIARLYSMASRTDRSRLERACESLCVLPRVLPTARARSARAAQRLYRMSSTTHTQRASARLAWCVCHPDTWVRRLCFDL